MTRKLLLCAAVAAALVGCQQKTEPAKTEKLETEEQKVAYGMGLNLGKRIKQEFTIDVDSFALGMRHAMNDQAKPLLTDEEIQKVMQDFQQKQIAKQESDFKAKAEKNKTDSEKYLADNGKAEGVKTTASGLQYKVVKEGTGPKPKAEDTVEVNYQGTLVDGTEFDSSYKRGQPATFPVSGVIPGWTEALQLMPVGSEFELVIPSDLAYGPGGAGGVIGPNSALKFKVELLAIKKPEAAEPAKKAK
jgi:FKBP-type peptidyl-prolyl cis-trans isomerase